MYPVIITVDGRETKVARELKNLNTEFTSKELHVGDVVFTRGEDTVLICERKTYADFASSIADGRYALQRESMKETGVKIVYIIEGPNKPRTDLDSKRVLGAMENLAMVHNISILPTLSVAETALAIKHFKKKLEEQVIRTGNDVVIPKVIQRKEKIMANVLLHQLQVIHGVSASVARAIVTEYPTMYALITAYEKRDNENERNSMLADIMVTKRKIGPAVSQRIHQALYGT